MCFIFFLFFSLSLLSFFLSLSFHLFCLCVAFPLSHSIIFLLPQFFFFWPTISCMHCICILSFEACALCMCVRVLAHWVASFLMPCVCAVSAHLSTFGAVSMFESTQAPPPVVGIIPTADHASQAAAISTRKEKVSQQIFLLLVHVRVHARACLWLGSWWCVCVCWGG